ncbi:MAG: hypothetical protein HQK63_11415 [Desulfamplus sp.]|nr:hypothetical protein [Desulfamplus sp.]
MSQSKRRTISIIALFLMLFLSFNANAQQNIILTDANPDTIITTGTTATVYGTSGANHVTIESGANVKLVNFPGSNTITIKSDSNNFTVSRSGAMVTFQGADGTYLKMPATIKEQIVIFNDTSFILFINDKKVKLNGTDITTTSTQLGDSDDGILDTSFLELETPGTYEIENDLTLQTNVKILTTEARQKANAGRQTRDSEDIILDEELNQIIITNPSTIYKVDDVLLLDDSSWKIKQINDNGSSLILDVQEAQLEEIIKDGNISFNLTPDWSSGEFDEDDTALLQKDAKAYFTLSRINSQRALSESDVDSQGAINLDDTSLFEFVTKYDAYKGGIRC